MAKRKIIEWDVMEPEYRAGQLSLKELGRRFDCSDAAIIKHAKKFGWTRNLAEKVREKIKENLVSGTVSGVVSPLKAAEIVKQAAERGTDIVLLHRKDIERQRQAHAEYQEMLSSIFDGHKVDGKVDLETLDSAVKISEALSRIIARIIPLERQAFGLDEDSGGGSGKGHELKITRTIIRADGKDAL